MAVAGIHFGNTNCCGAVSKEGRIEVVSNDTGERVTATCVAYTGSEKLVGYPAKQHAIRSPASVINNIKNTIGISHVEDTQLQKLQERCSCKVIDKSGAVYYQVKVEDASIDVPPEKAGFFVLTKLLEDAEAVAGTDLEDIVLCVPVSSSEKHRIEISEAAEEAGFNVLRLISEPSAALLAYGIGQDDPNLNCKVLVYRLGGSSVNATLVEVISGMYRIVSYKENLDLGGQQFDDMLVKHCIHEFKKQWRHDVSENSKAVRKLRMAAERCKCGLSQLNSAACSVESLHEGIDFHIQITRAKFESLCADVFNRCLSVVWDLLTSCQVQLAEVNKVILVGGTTRIPKVQQILKDKFSNSEILSKISPEEVLASGAAVQASLLQGREDIGFADLTCQLDCVPHNICVEVIENNTTVMKPIIQKFAPVPVRRSFDFGSLENGGSVCLRVYEVADMKKDNSARLLAKVVMKGVAPKSQLVSVLEVKRDGTLQVSLQDKTSQKTESICIDPAT